MNENLYNIFFKKWITGGHEYRYGIHNIEIHIWFLKGYDAIISSSEHSFDCVPGDGVEEEKDEEGQEEDDDHLHDGPLVVVPDDVPDWLQRI